MPSFSDKLKEVTEQRGKVYASPEVNFAITADLLNAAGFRIMVDDKPTLLGPEHYPVIMICAKLARLVKNDKCYHADTLLDIAGYAKCAEVVNERLYQEQRSLKEPIEGVVSDEPTLAEMEAMLAKKYPNTNANNLVDNILKCCDAGLKGMRPL